MPLLIAIDISLSNLMLMGPLTNTQKTHTLPSFYTQHKMMDFFPRGEVHQLCLCSPYPARGSPAAGCCCGLSLLVPTTAPLARLYRPAQDGTRRMQHRPNESYLDHGHGGISSSSRWREKHA